jgi:hypothetical protein
MKFFLNIDGVATYGLGRVSHSVFTLFGLYTFTATTVNVLFSIRSHIVFAGVLIIKE